MIVSDFQRSSARGKGLAGCWVLEKKKLRGRRHSVFDKALKIRGLAIKR